VTAAHITNGICNHGNGPITGIRHGLICVYTRPWWRLFRRTYWKRCHYCDLREQVDSPVAVEWERVRDAV
jgi:hypothetical protein